MWRDVARDSIFVLAFLIGWSKSEWILDISVPGQLTGTRIPDPPFSSFGPSRDFGMDLCLEVYL